MFCQNVRISKLSHRANAAQTYEEPEVRALGLSAVIADHEMQSHFAYQTIISPDVSRMRSYTAITCRALSICGSSVTAT